MAIGASMERPKTAERLYKSEFERRVAAVVEKFYSARKEKFFLNNGFPKDEVEEDPENTKLVEKMGKKDSIDLYFPREGRGVAASARLVMKTLNSPVSISSEDIKELQARGLKVHEMEAGTSDIHEGWPESGQDCQVTMLVITLVDRTKVIKPRS